MTPVKGVTTQEKFDHMEQQARMEADELFGEWLKEYFGDRGVPGMPQEQPDMQGVYNG